MNGQLLLSDQQLDHLFTRKLVMGRDIRDDRRECSHLERIMIGNRDVMLGRNHACQPDVFRFAA